MPKKIIMLVGGGTSSRWMYNGIKDDFEISNIVVVGPPPGGMKKFLMRRVKRLGYWQVFGQILFQAGYLKILNALSKKRISEIKAEFGISEEPLPEDLIINVPWVNSDECLKTLNDLNPDIIIVNGTSLIFKKILNGVNATFVNTHVGITPKYRGVHGGYWSLASDDKENCGVTVHLVDPGIDTGGILHQGFIEVTKKDNFATYPMIQTAEGIKMMKLALNDIINDNVNPKKGTEESKLWYHPTLWRYLWTWMTKGVK
ncbi:MAG: formyl transferase [Flavobacteriaceae bacterium]|nr:formyl transferase [Bacteroidia bacterium]NNK29195.1 formyl transferase [Flavobacteriaceae bacterium]NNL61164.1 formyl transferase [Flavobacteriaceae bacterium]